MGGASNKNYNTYNNMRVLIIDLRRYIFIHLHEGVHFGWRLWHKDETSHREVDPDVNILERIINNLSIEDPEELDLGLHYLQRQPDVLVPSVVEVPLFLQVLDEVTCKRHAEV